MIRRASDGYTATLRDLIWELLRCGPCSDGNTAAGLQYWMKDAGWDVKLSSLSSQLSKMVKAGELTVLPETGPRGGKVYFRPEE